MTGIFITSVSAQAFSTPLYRPIIVVFGDSYEVETTVHTLVADYPYAIIINYQDTHSLLNVLTLIRSHSPLILVGHGSEYGILGPSGAMISWQDIGAWVNTLPNTYVFFLACNSNSATKFVHIPSYGFSGTIDGVLGAINIAANLQYASGNTKAVRQLLSQYVSRVIVLQTDRAKFLPLICYNGPTQSSSSSLSSNIISPDTTCPPPPPPPPTYTVVFTESGLPSGTSWSVTLNGNTKAALVDAASDPSSIYFEVNAGTYSYSVLSPIEYNSIEYGSTPSSGTVSVGNGDITVSIIFTPISKTINAEYFGTSCTLQSSDPNYSNPPDYVFDCLGSAEFQYWSYFFITGLLVGLFGASIAYYSPETPFWAIYVGQAGMVNIASFAYVLGTFLDGNMDAANFVIQEGGVVLGLIGAALQTIYDIATQNLDFSFLAVLAGLMLQVAGWIASGSATFDAELLIILGSWLVAAAGFLVDQSDTNDVIGL